MIANEPTIRLRAMEPEDLDVLYQIENDRDTWDVGTTNVPYSRYALHNYMAHTSSDIFSDKELRLMIEKEDGVVIGIADLMNFDPKNQRAEIGLVIQKEYRGKGYARVTLRLLHDYVRKTIHLHQLFAVIPASNKHTCDLFRSEGYQESTSLKDWLFDGSSYKTAVVMQFIFS